MDVIIIRYSEVGLKGKNRSWFENLLIRNIKSHLSKYSSCSVSKIHGRIIVQVDDNTSQVMNALACVPGIANFSPATRASHQLGDISRKAVDIFERSATSDHSTFNSFKVSAKRSDKSFPLNSPKLAEQIGSDILDKYPDFKVDLTNPDISVGIEIWPNDQSILFEKKIPGQGGLPVGSAGNVLSLISGGIDSPVASWMMMKRGCVVRYIHFHSYPFTGEQSRQKVVDLVTHLSRFQPDSTLLIIPFAEIQKAIQKNCKEKNRTVLYRRSMYHIANRLKEEFSALGYVTGEAVGQVASQTLENIACTEDTASIPVLRPLIGMEKAEIINLAKHIGTYDISIQPFPDCCTVFQPKKPEIHGDLEEMRNDEQNIEMEHLVEESLDNIERLEISSQVRKRTWG